MSTAPSALPRHPGAARSGADGDAATQSGVRRLADRIRPELLVLVAIAALLNLVNLGVNGNANEYYSAAVHSMTQSWTNFFFGAFDAAGLQTVDKPPLAFWIQAASAKVFGFGTWAFLVPQALMGIATTVLVYDLVRRRFGRTAGFVSGLILATTPTAVAVFRHNNPDALLMLCATLALWATVRAFETPNRTRWLVLAGVAVGLGFEAKMAAALFTVPAIVAAWLWVRPLGLGRSIKQVAAFSAAAAATGLAWPIAVWLTPEGSRPWISGTSDNSIWSLIFGYNGLGRVLGQDGGPGGNTGGGPGGGGMGGMFGGDTGVLRLLNDSLGSQGGWFLGLAIGGAIVLLLATQLKRADARTGWLIATAGSFATTAVAFSFASGIFHPYYVSALAPFTAALVGAGLATMVGVSTAQAGILSPNAVAANPTVVDDATAAREDELAAARAAYADIDPSTGKVDLGELPAAPRGGLWKDPVTGAALATEQAARAEAGALATAQASADADGGPSVLIRAVGGAALVAGAVTEWIVLSDATQLGWLKPILIAGTLAAGVALVLSTSRKVRLAAVAGAAGLLLVAPTVWAVQTPGHATQGTFPTGGPESAGGMGGPGGGRGGFGGGGMRGNGGTFTPPSGGFPGAQGSAGTSGFTPPAGGFPGRPGQQSRSGAQSGSGTQGAPSFGGGNGGPGGGGMFGGDQSSVTAALAYIKANGGGTLVVSSQSGAAPQILSTGADVAGIGGFSGRESEVSVSWLAERVASGDVRWVLASSGGLRDSRTGSNTVMEAVSSTCKAVSSVDGLYDCQGQDSALSAAAS